jgi:DNA polymerase III alpha subunit
MQTTEFGELVFDDTDLCDLVMRGTDIAQLKNVTVSDTVDIARLVDIAQDPSCIATWHTPADTTQSLEEFDRKNQLNWYMPREYRSMDIAEHVLGLCNTQAELQRCGQELLMFQERSLFDLLRYLKYLVDTMIKHQVIWGVGRGSSVASYVLYKLGVHRVDSMYYDLDPQEFLR